jgi:hypothetical protein
MAGESYIQLFVKAPDALIPAIQDAVGNVITDRSPKSREGEWRLAENEVWINDANEVADALDELMDSGSEAYFIKPTPFAYKVWTDPDDESLGIVRMSVPGPDDPLTLQQDCEHGGDPRPDVRQLIRMMDAATTLEEARTFIVNMTGGRVRAAYDAYVTTATPRDFAADCPVCEGDGENPNDPEFTCDNCKGSGKANVPFYDEKQDKFVIPDNG